MTTPAPTGKLAWGQAGNYDASDDRAVITAVTAARVGLVRPVTILAGAGLQVIIRGGWVGVASCDDLTSAVVGSRDETVVQANPGPATGSREDVVWCSTNPDEGTWELSVMTRAQSAGRTGIPLATIIAPANSNLASQMDIKSVDASIERRVLSVNYMGSGQGFNDYNATGWAAAVGRGVESDACFMEPGQWYRVRYVAHCCSLVLGTIPPANTRLEGAVAIGERTDGQLPATSQLRRGFVFAWPFYTVPTIIQAEYVFRHALSDAPVWRRFDGRIWKHSNLNAYNNLIRPGGYTELGPFVQTLTVEDLGS